MGFCFPATFIFFNIQYTIKIAPNNSIIVWYACYLIYQMLKELWIILIWCMQIRFASVIRTSCPSPPPGPLQLMLVFMRTHTPASNSSHDLNIQCWPHSFFIGVQLLLWNVFLAEILLNGACFTIHWKNCFRLLQSHIPFTFSDRKLLNPYAFLVMVVFLDLCMRNEVGALNIFTCS